MLKSFKVGELFQEGKTSYMEGCKVDITDSGINVFVTFGDPTTDEIENFKNGKVKYGYYVEKDVIMMLFKFGNQQWMDAPYNVNLSKKLSNLQNIDDGLGYAVNIFLIDAKTGILKVSRLIGMETNMSRKIKEEVLKQQHMNFNIYNYNININNIYNKYTTKELVARGKVIY